MTQDYNKRIRTVIIDDEDHCISTLLKMLDMFCPEIEVLGTAGSVEDAIKLINRSKPELVFLDINLVNGDGFTVLELVEKRDFGVIFTTAFDYFAIRAIEFSALGYLLKPVNFKELVNAVNRYKEFRLTMEKYEFFKQNLGKNLERIVLPRIDGYDVVPVDEIVFCEGVDKYTVIRMKDKKEITVSKMLNEVEEALEGLSFFRISNNVLINLTYVKSYDRSRTPTIRLEGNYTFEVASRRKKDFFESLKKIIRSV